MKAKFFFTLLLISSLALSNCANKNGQDNSTTNSNSAGDQTGSANNQDSTTNSTR